VTFCDKLRELPKDVRLNFLNDAIKWANDPTYKTGEYDTWAGTPHRRLRDVLKVVDFSNKVNADVLEGFIFWNVQLGEELKQTSDVFKTSDVLGAEVLRETTRAKGEAPSDYWIEIPAGKFVMGSDKGRDDERPQHTIEIPYTYKIARYPVTNAEFAKFVNATKYKTMAEEKGFGRVYDPKKFQWVDVKGANWAHPSGSESTIDQIQDHPVVQVSWRDAIAYCEWLNKDLAGLENPRGLVVRLPTEAEWEKAARGEYGKEYPWGDEFDASKCNTSESGIGTTTPVGKFSPQGDSPYGVADMSGNVWEWCQSKSKPYPYKANDGREKLDGDENRVLRGGSWFSDQRYCCAASRYWLTPLYFSLNIGFRLALSPMSS
jgi:formylglycine-generating enzyme required for sulfatase activity